LEKLLSFSEILNLYLDEGQVTEFSKMPSATAGHDLFNEDINLLDPHFVISRRMQIENLVTLTEKDLPKVKFVDLFLFLSKQAINIGLLGLAEDILGLLIKKIEASPKLKDYLATAYFNLGELYFRQGYWKKTESIIGRARKIFQAEKNRTGVFRCDNLLGAVLGEKGDMIKALNNFNKTLLALNPKKERYLQAMLESNIGILHQSLHNFEESIVYLKRALIYFEQIGDLNRISELKYNIANLFYLKKDYTQAIMKLDEAIAAASSAENLPFLCLCFVTKSDALLYLNDVTVAAALINYAMEISNRINDRLSIAEVYKIKGKIELELKNFEFAETLLLTSLRLNKELENKYNLAETCVSLSKLYKLKKNSKESARYQIMALLYFNEVKMQTNTDVIFSTDLEKGK